VIGGEFQSIEMGGWSSISEFECSLIKMRESGVLAIVSKNSTSALELGSMKAARLHILMKDGA